jgi:glycosyltransferase involved in cell wall biosynthesis
LPVGAANFLRKDLWTPSHHRIEKWSFAAEIIPDRLDVIHSPDFIPPTFGAKRRIITIHDLNFLYYPEYLNPDSRRYYANQINWAARSANHIIADSEYTRQDLIDSLKVPAEKVTTIYLAANPVYSQQQDTEMVNTTLAKYSLPAGFILFVGTLSPRKNAITLVQAYYKLYQEKGVDLPLVIVGNKGWQSLELFKKIDELGIQDQVKHLEGLHDDELARLYSAASVLALPSYYEGFGLPPLEAMHCGCPVVVSNRASLPEIVGDAGLYCEPDDVNCWAEALIKVISDSDQRLQMIDAGHRQTGKFTWSSTARKTLELYLEYK